MSFESGPALKEAPKKRRRESMPIPPTEIEPTHEDSAETHEADHLKRQEHLDRLREQIDESVHLPTLDRTAEKQMMGLKAKPKFEVKGVAKRTLWQRIKGIFS